ncbi:ATP-binding protein, partial [Salmonella enterica subsp. enterica serovar Typhimurium]
HEQLSGDALEEEMTQRDAQSMIDARRCDVQPVANQQGEPCGTLHIRDLLSETTPRETTV